MTRLRMAELEEGWENWTRSLVFIPKERQSIIALGLACRIRVLPPCWDICALPARTAPPSGAAAAMYMFPGIRIVDNKNIRCLRVKK